jgi:hypothetical protein
LIFASQPQTQLSLRLGLANTAFVASSALIEGCLRLNNAAAPRSTAKRLAATELRGATYLDIRRSCADSASLFQNVWISSRRRLGDPPRSSQGAAQHGDQPHASGLVQTTGYGSHAAAMLSTVENFLDIGSIGHLMKHPPKPFAVEIKRSRRLPASAAPIDLFGKESSMINGAISGIFSKRRDSSNPPGLSEFAIPSFLQTDKAARLTPSDHLSIEAAQVFRPRPTLVSDDRGGPAVRPEPRILPSLIEPSSDALDDGADSAAPQRKARRSQSSRAQAPRDAAKTDRVGAIPAPAKRRAGDVAAAAEALSKHKPAMAWNAAPASAEPTMAPPPESAAESNAARSDENRRGARVRRVTRRGREDAAALPPGQHWKRRLNPRAW